ncbi:MAG: hypothetical protein H0U76_17415 [Ktedonobacteraceae bacterium]|nr:hypothetical protein [Ktedonobacteraceae bacterium]
MERIIIQMPEYWHHIEAFSQRPLKGIEMEIPKYAPAYGVIPVGSDRDYMLAVQIAESPQEVMITADKEGLIVLARHLLTLAQDDVPSGSHIHYDDSPSSGSLAKASCSMVVSKM